MLNDLRHAIRLLIHAKGWTAVVVVSLALGIGANAALFGAVNGMFLRKIPVRDPDSLVRLRTFGRNDMSNSSSDYGFNPPDFRATFSYPMFQQFVADNQTMTDLIACAPYIRGSVVVNGQPDLASLFVVSGNYFQVLGITARLGRTILPDDDQPSAPGVAVISSRYWRSRFGSDSRVAGTSIRVNNLPVTIVGVLPPAFTGVQQAVAEPADVSLPISLETQLSVAPTGAPGTPPRLAQPTNWWVQVLGRLKSGVTAAQVEANLGGLFQNQARAGMESYLSKLPDAQRSLSGNRIRREVPELRVDSGAHGVYDVNVTDRRSVTILAVVVAIVLLIVCANVANLLLSRATTRQKELAVRLSLGATRSRLVRQLLTESVLLAAIGGGLGVAVGYWGQQLLPGAPGRGVALDWHVLSFIAAVTTATGILFGILPALRATRVNVHDSLKESGRGVVVSRSWLTRALLIAQVAMSLVLLVGAGLFLRTLQNLRDVDVGFNPNNLLLFRVNPQLNRYDDQRTIRLYQDLTERLKTLPGVKGVGLSNPALLSGSGNGTAMFVRGRTYVLDRRDRSNDINRVVVSATFFEALGIPVVAGRGFDNRDTYEAPKVAIINETAARKFFPGASPLGEHFGYNPDSSETQMEIVGVIRDTKYNSVREPAPPTTYVPYEQTPATGVTFELRTTGDPYTIVNSVREAVRQVDANLPVADISTQSEQIETRLLQERLFAQACMLFGVLAGALAAIGLFGLMSYNVSRRTNEIGVRMALGARAATVLGLIMRESMWLVAGGVAIGLLLAFAAGRLIASQLFGLAPTDAGTFLLATLLMVAVSAAAGYLPARRASRVDPNEALRYE
jgi:predicted permease